MALFTTSKKPETVISEAASIETSEEHPQRPGTSGTEIILTKNRRRASAQYLAAQRAEQTYKAKKRSEGARQHRAEANTHFKQSAAHFKEGCKSTWAMAAVVPWMVRGWREDRQKVNAKKKRERDMEKKRKLEEKLAKQVNEGKENGSGAGEEVVA